MEKSGEMVRAIYSQNGIYILTYLPFIVHCPPSSAKYVEAPKIGPTTRGIPTQSGPWLVAPFLFGVVGLTGDNGTSFPICVCV